MELRADLKEGPSQRTFTDCRHSQRPSLIYWQRMLIFCAFSQGSLSSTFRPKIAQYSLLYGNFDALPVISTLSRFSLNWSWQYVFFFLLRYSGAMSPLALRSATLRARAVGSALLLKSASWKQSLRHCRLQSLLFRIWWSWWTISGYSLPTFSSQCSLLYSCRKGFTLPRSRISSTARSSQ